MQAIILAAGQGTRLRPLTNNQPKCLVPVAGIPIIDRLLNELPALVNEVIVVIGYHGDLVREHLKHYSKHKVTFVEVEPLGTGYAVKECQKHTNGNFLVLNGDDLYKQSDLEKLCSQQNTFLVKQMPQSGKFGSIMLDESGNFTDIQTTQVGQDSLIYIGANALTQAYFDWPLAQTKSGEYGLPQTLLVQAQQGVQFKALPAEFWFPINSLEDLSHAEAYFKQG